MFQQLKFYIKRFKMYIYRKKGKDRKGKRRERGKEREGQRRKVGWSSPNLSTKKIHIFVKSCSMWYQTNPADGTHIFLNMVLN